MNRRELIRRRVLRGLALNRQPGLHFPGNFLDVSFDSVARDVSRLSIAPGVWCLDEGRETDLGSLLILADLALAACMRAHLSRESRLATVAMHLQFTGAARSGQLEAEGRFQGFFKDGAEKLGLSQVCVQGRGGTICVGSGTFMGLKAPRNVALHPVPLRNRRSAEPARLRQGDLSVEELDILQHANKALAARGSFVRNFWGYRPRRVAAGAESILENGLHVGNRVGHAQGGILLGQAAVTAQALLPAHWKLSGVSAWFTSPGDGRKLRAHAKIVHQGRLTAVIRTRITGRNRRRVLEVVTSHAASA